jgi:hypothetical protein
VKYNGASCSIGIQEVGIYIYSHLYTVLGALGRLLLCFTAANVVEGPINPFFWLNNPPALPFAAFHHPPWDYGIVFILWLGTPPAEGVAFKAASYPSNWSFGGELFVSPGIDPSYSSSSPDPK